MDKTRMGKRVASLLLSLVMMLSLLPTAAYATMADGVDTQGAIVSENGTGVSDDSNSSGNTDDLQVGGSSGSGTADDTTGAEGGADPTDSVNGNDSADPQDDGDAVMPVASSVVSTSEELVAAIAAASDGDTITLGEGEFTTVGNTSPKKSLTFVGAGEGTVWTIGDLDQAPGGENNGDHSFDGCETITFKNMTLNADNENYRGFIRINNTVVENCTLEGRTAYWGYETAKFVNSTFNAPEGDYALWDYSTKAMTFEGCTFNISGKGVNVYVEAGNAGEATRTVAVKDCTVESTKENKAFLNIKNSTQAYDVTLSGTNTVNGLTADGTTGSALYQVETTEVTETTGNPVTVKQENTAGEFETVYEVKETVAETTMDLDAFIKAVEASGYNYDGNGVTVKWSPVTGCYDTREGHDCTAGNVKATGNTPKRVSADYAQYQLFSGLTQNVTIKNVKFVYEPAAFTICANSGWAGSGTVTNLAELQFENKGDVKLLDCSFDGVAVAVFNDIETASTAVHGCSFTNMTKAGGGYAIHYLKGGKIDVSENTFENVYRGMLVQSTVNKGTNIVNNNFSGIDATNSSCYMVKLLNVKDTDIVISGNTTAANAPVNVNVAYHGTDGAAIAVGDRISTIHTAETDGNSVKISTGGDQMTGYTAPSAAVEDASGITVDADGNVTVTLPAKTTYVAEVKGVKYKSLQAAINAAGRKATVTLLADTRENVTIAEMMTLDLNGHTLNGGTVKGKPALTVTARVTVKDSSAAKTGTIMREDTAENSGVSSHYVIDIQGKGWLTFESGNVKNNSGVVGVKGASLVRVGDDSVAEYPGLTISGGTFTQDNFIVIKVDRGTFYLKEDGTLNSKNSYAVENWKFAEIKGGTVNGTVAAWTYSGGHNSDLTISGGTINGDVTSVNYGGAEGKVAKVSITGGTVNGALDTRSYDPSTNELTSIDDATKATIAVTGGTFSKDPTKYVVEDSAITPNADGTYGVAKAYLAKVGDTSYYTMDEAFKAQTTSSKAIVLLRDYTTGSTFNSGSIARTVDLNGHTWTCTGTDANSAAFEINYPDASLTVKNGKVVSSQLVGLIPSAMGGTIKYDNSSLVFDGVEMTTNARSGIETNGNNTNDTVTLRNSTLNVPNGFGIYFPSSGTLTIDNSVINAKTMGVQVCSGSLNISGADTAITVTGDGIDKTINDGAIEDGAAISIVNRIGYKGLTNIEVKGGTFTAKGDNAAVKAYKWENQTASAFDNSKNVVAISGGTFSSAVDKSLCAGGYIPTQNADGTYGVKEGADGYVEDENGNVTISTAEGLFYFAKKANAGNNFAGKTVTLANNIDLNDEKWTPIGSFNDATTQFKGTFDGQNHAVTGLKVEESNKQGVGFFGKVYTGTIKNLTVEGSVSASNCNYVGGIVGHGYATITNCTFKGTVGNNNSMQVGGIAGSGGFTVTDCSVYADVTAQCWAGGIVGNCQDGGAYTNCYVEGTISSEETYWGGGAAGITPVPLYPSQVISGCYSNTVVKVAGEEVNCPIIACYNNPLDHDGYSGGLKIYDNSWNKQKNSNDSYPIYAEKDGKGGVLMEGMTAARDNSLIMLEDDLNYVTGDLSKVRIMAGSSVTQAQIDALAVASVGDSKYKFLTEAIDAAQDGQTVTLLADATKDVVISKSITLDLGGKTLTNTNAGNATISVQSGTVTVKDGNVKGGTGYYNIEAKKDANLTLTDVTATAGNTGSSMIDNWGTLTITSGTYTGGLNVVKSEEDSKLTITGGTFELSYATNGYTGVIFAYGDTTISGGEFIQSLTTTGRWNHPTVVLTGVVEGHTAITRVTGGHFVNKMSGESIFRGVGKATSDNFKVSGGTFNKSIPDAYCADGFIPTKNADGTYGVKEGQYVAEIGSKKYETLADAIRLAAKGRTITLLADVEQNTQLTINKSITLDLNGKTIKNTEDIWGETANAILSITNGAKVTITGNGTIDAKENDCYTINVVKGDLTIENGTFYGNVSVVQVEEGTLSVKGGTFDLHQKWEGSSKYLFNCIDEAYVDGSANVAISGGTFVGFDPNVSPEQKVDGKTPSFAAPGAGITKNEDGSFTAAAGMTAQILDKDGNSVKAYSTLADAINAAQGGQTVRLLADVEQNTQLTINKSITLDLNGKTIKNTEDIWGETANAILSITNGAKVTITGNGTIDAKENDCYTINVVKGDLTIENGTFYGNVSVVQVEEGTLSVKGGTFDLHQKWEGSSKYLFNCIDEAYVDGSANVAISGGTFVGFDPNVSPEQKVDGKTPSFAAPGAGITKNEDGSFTAAAGMTAQILDKDGNSVKAYSTLADAVAAAQDGQTVRLLANVTLDAQIATGKAITIDGQSKYTIKADKLLVSADNKAGMFYRTGSANGTLTFLNVTLDGNGVSKIFLNEGGAGETVFDGVTSTNGGGWTYGSGIHISGGGSHATIRNSTLTGSTGTMELNDTNYYAANDLWVGGNVYVTVENSVIGTVFVNSAPSATATNGVVHGQLTITGESTKITYLSGEEESADKLDKFGNNGSLVKIDSGYVEKVFDKGSYAISGGTFKTKVEKEWCAAGYVPTQNGDGTYGVAVGMFTVMVTSRTTGSNSPVANVAGGGSNITYAQGTKVTASAISGYKFVGWFVNEYTGTPYSTELTCAVKPTADCTMIAVYEPISGGKFWLTVTASEFTVNGGAVQDSYLYEQFAVGASVTVNFTGSENFLYWVNASNKVVSTEKSYTFIMGSETTLKAVYGKARQNQATVVFISHSDQIISSKAYTTNDTIQFPVPPIKMGCTFTGWSMTEAEIRAAMASNSGIIQVRALYTEPSIACKVTVVYPEGTDNQVVNAVVGKAIDVTAKDIEGKTFSYWTDSDGNILGYTKTLKLAPSGDMTVKAVYGENAEVKPVISMTAIDASAGNGYWVVSFTATRAVPAGYEMVKQGILYSLDSRCAGEAGKDYLKLTADGTVPEGVYDYIGRDTALNGVTRFNGKVGTADTTLYGRGYMILKNSAGEVLYVYADTILSGSYNSLKK